MDKEKHKQYCKEWRKKFKEINGISHSTFIRRKDPELSRQKERAKYLKNKAKGKKRINTDEDRVKMNKYKRDYAKKPEEKKKHNIRQITQRIYGKVPEGYHRHHFNYDSPHNFELITIKEHGVKHRIDK